MTAKKAKTASKAKNPAPPKKTAPAAAAQAEISKGGGTETPPEPPGPAPEDQAREAAEWKALEAEAAADAARPPGPAAPAATQADAARQAEQYPKDPQVEQAIHQLLDIGFGTFAPNWRVSPQEIEAAADAYARSIEDIFPGGAAVLGPHFASILITLAMFGPRMATRTPPRLEEKPKEQAGQDNTGKPADTGADDGLAEKVPE